MSEYLFTEKDWMVRSGMMRLDGRMTWQAMVLAVTLPWVLVLWIA